MNYDNTNSGALFKNDKKGVEKRPDYRGTVNVNGVDYDLSAWLKSSKAGAKYMSLRVQPKRSQDDRRQESRAPADILRESHPDFDDDIPFN